MTSWLLLGCGYTGAPLARALAASDAASSVTITRRDPEAARALAASLAVPGRRCEIRGVAADLADLSGLAIAPGTIVVCLAPPGDDPAAEIAGLVAAARHAARIVYVSSTGVYGPGRGAWVDESWPLEPITASGHARVAAEAALARAAVPWIALRAVGIYGPGRGLVERIRAGIYRVIGDGTSHVCRIHVDDLVAAIIAAGTRAVTGAVNIADDDPAPIGAGAVEAAAMLGMPPPPRVAASTVPSEVSGMLTADRRIANRRMTDELGVVLRYPSWRDGLAAELLRLRNRNP
jgi:nucleoside-diphosphate-sugar epimerase